MPDMGSVTVVANHYGIVQPGVISPGWYFDHTMGYFGDQLGYWGSSGYWQSFGSNDYGRGYDGWAGSYAY
jgi:hypothetical protein